MHKLLPFKLKFKVVMKRFVFFLLIAFPFGFTIGCNKISSNENHLKPLISSKQFNLLFPHRHKVYTYEGLKEAAAKFPLFLAEGDLRTRKNELAAFLAIIAQETTGGWAEAPGGPLKWGLVFNEEQACITGNCPVYNSPGRSAYIAVPGKNYYGRGAMQISYLYNYGEAGKDLNLPLVDQPELLSENSVAAFESAIWFWMRKQNNKPSCHEVLTGAWQPSPEDISLNRKPGFGMIINIVNGGVECGSQRTADAASKASGRIAFYKYFTASLHIEADSECDCATMGYYIMSEQAPLPPKK